MFLRQYFPITFADLNGDLLYSFALFGVAFLLILSYAAKSLIQGKARYDRTDKEGGSALLSKGMMEMAYWGLQPVGDFLIFLRLTPNAISILSFVFGALTGIALAFGHFGSAGFLSTISSLMDSLDGMVARKTGVAYD